MKIELKEISVQELTNENANLVGNDGKKNYFINKDGRIIQSAYQRLFIRHKTNKKW